MSWPGLAVVPLVAVPAFVDPDVVGWVPGPAVSAAGVIAAVVEVVAVGGPEVSAEVPLVAVPALVYPLVVGGVPGPAVRAAGALAAVVPVVAVVPARGVWLAGAGGRRLGGWGGCAGRG